MAVNENTLEKAIIAELQGKGYEYVYGPDITRDYHEVILEDCFRSSMLNINPDITQEIISEAFKAIKNLGLLRLEELNASFHKYLIEGVPVPYKKNGENRTFTVRLVDFINPEANDFKVINQFTIIEYKNKRPDILVFINGIPMVLFELKNMANTDTTEEEAYKEQAAAVLFSYEKTEGLYSGREAFITCVEKDTLSPSVPTFMLRREYILRSGLCFEEGILHEDIGYIFDMLTRADRVRLLHKALFCRRFRAHSTVTGGFTVKHVLGYLKSWQKAAENHQELLQRFGEDPAFWHAFRKWTRDIAGRIRVLYLQSEEKLYPACPPDPAGETALLLELLKQTSTGKARAEDILGKEMIQRLTEAGSVYVCGNGQYANRMLDVLGALAVEICGVLETDRAAEGRKTFRGFPVLDPFKEADRKKPVIMAMSHYQTEKYRRILTEAGFRDLFFVTF